MNSIEYAQAVKPLIDALLEGKTLQYKNNGTGEWIDHRTNDARGIKYLNVADYDFRVKPEPVIFYRNLYHNGWGSMYHSLEEAKSAVQLSANNYIRTAKFVEQE